MGGFWLLAGKIHMVILQLLFTCMIVSPTHGSFWETCPLLGPGAMWWVLEIASSLLEASCKQQCKQLLLKLATYSFQVGVVYVVCEQCCSGSYPGSFLVVAPPFVVVLYIFL